MFKILTALTVTLSAYIIYKLNKLSMNQQELAQALKDLFAQVNKSKDEVVAKIQTLENAINNAGSVSPEVETALNDLKGSVQSLDDLNPDATGGTTEEPA